MKVMHFVIDGRFIPFVQRTFEQAYPGGNAFRVLPTEGVPLRFVVPGQDVRVPSPEYWTSDAVTRDLQDFDCLIIHYMKPEFAAAVGRIPEHLLVMWAGWGADYYNLIEPYFGELVLDNTRTMMRELRRRPRSIINRLVRRFKLNFAYRTQAPAITEIVARIDLLWVNPEEVEFVERALPNFHGTYHRMFYYSAEESFAIGPERWAGPNILLGNSATATNNHLEAFEALRKLDLDGRLILAPLSYGDREYADAVCREGARMFGDRFVPIRDYLAMDEYYERLRTCGTVVMNHIRQQAGTTIATALYKGAKVFLRNENPVMPYYRKMGITLFSIQADLHPAADVFEPLTHETVVKHREVLDDYWSHEAAVATARDLETHVARKRGVDV